MLALRCVLRPVQGCVNTVVGAAERCWRLKRVVLLCVLRDGLKPAGSAQGGPAGRWVQRGVHIPNVGNTLKAVGAPKSTAPVLPCPLMALLCIDLIRIDP